MIVDPDVNEKKDLLVIFETLCGRFYVQLSNKITNFTSAKHL